MKKYQELKRGNVQGLIYTLQGMPLASNQMVRLGWHFRTSVAIPVSPEPWSKWGFFFDDMNNRRGRVMDKISTTLWPGLSGSPHYRHSS